MDNTHSRHELAEATVPKAVVSRLSLYLRELQHIVREGQETTSSTQLGERLGLTDAQIRKDLAYFGQFGYPGVGYRCDELVREIRRILGTNRDWPVAMVGLGNLGTALIRHGGFARQGFRIVAAFDVLESKIGTTVGTTAGTISVYGLESLDRVVARHAIKLGILAVPAAAAQEVADQLVKAGIEGIMNFAPVTIVTPARVRQVAVDLAIELEQLSFAVVNRQESV